MRFRDDEGFTLIEAVVSIAIFAIVATAATFAIVSSARASSATDLRVAAGQIAQQQLDRIVLLGAEPREAPTSGTVTADDRTFDVEISGYEGDCDSFRDITVVVSTRVSNNQSVSARLDTRLACPQTSLDGFAE